MTSLYMGSKLSLPKTFPVSEVIEAIQVQICYIETGTSYLRANDYVGDVRVLIKPLSKVEKAKIKLLTEAIDSLLAIQTGGTKVVAANATCTGAVPSGTTDCEIRVSGNFGG